MERTRDGEHIDHLMHCANNCRQMLNAIDRKLARALILLDEGDVAKSRKLLSAVSTALPEAMAIIAHKRHLAEAPDSGSEN